jgi:hypothetical protein
MKEPKALFLARLPQDMKHEKITNKFSSSISDSKFAHLQMTILSGIIARNSDPACVFTQLQSLSFPFVWNFLNVLQPRV